jgi:hypothetical protein
MQSLQFAPRIPMALWVGLALAACGLLWWYGRTLSGKLSPRRRAVCVLLMAVVVVLPLIVLLNPMWLEVAPPPEGNPTLSILIDASASMETADGEDGATRFDLARQTALRCQQVLGDRFDVELYTFDGQVHPTDAEQLAAAAPAGMRTDVRRALASALQSDHPAGHAVLLLSDGIHSGSSGEVLELAEKSKAMSAPIFGLPLGGKADVKNASVEFASSQELVFAGQKAPLTVKLSSRGLGGQSVQLDLLLDGETIESKQQTLAADGSVEVGFEVEQEKPGLYRYRVAATPLAGEATDVDNQATLLLRVVDQPMQVLILEGKPYWDSKFLLRHLAADPSINVLSVVRMAEDRLLKRRLTTVAAESTGEVKDEGDEDESTERQRAAEWEILRGTTDVFLNDELLDETQIIILGRGSEAFLSPVALTRIRRWLSQGGGSLVCSRGTPVAKIDRKLGALLPVRWSSAGESRFRVELTADGEQVRWLAGGGGAGLLEQLPSLASQTHVEATGPLAVVLAAAVSSDTDTLQPVVSYQPYGAGRVVVVEGAGMWRWAFLQPQYAEKEQVYGTLWSSLLRWLVSRVGLLPGQQASLQSDRVVYSTTETASATLLLREPTAGDDLPAVRLTGDSLDEPQTLAPRPVGDEPGVYQVAFEDLPAGQYQAQTLDADGQPLGGPTAFDVRSPWTERLDVDAQRELIERVAAQSGGALLKGDDPEALATAFEEHLKRSHPPQVRRTMAWDRAWVLLLIIAAWAACWGVRRSSGLV